MKAPTQNKPFSKLRKFSLFLSALLALSGVGALFASLSLTLSHPVPATADSGTTVRVGWYPTAGLQDGTKDSDLGGYNYEYLAKIAQYANWKYQFVYGDWPSLETKLINGEIDLLGDVAETPERLQNYNFCTYPNGSSRMLMIARANDGRYFYNDYQAFDGMKVATIHSSFRKGLLDREAAQHHFSVNYQEYDNDAEMFSALDQGLADTAILSNVTRYQNYRIISEWEPNPFYFVVSKSQDAILSGLNNAMAQIQSSDIFMQERLFEKYFEGNAEGSMIALTREEDAYIKSQKSVEVLVCAKERPISYQEGTEIRGIVPDYLDLLKDKIGLAFRYKVFPNHAEMLKAFKEGQGSLCGQFPDDFQYGEENGAMLSQPYMSLTYGFVSTPQKIDALKNVGYEEGDRYLSEKIQALGYGVLPFDSPEGLLNALTEGKVDAVVLNSMVYEQFSYHAKYRDFSFYVRPELSLRLCLGVSKKADPLLLSAIDKAAGALTSAALEKIRVGNSSVVPDWTADDYFRTNGITLLFLFFLALFLAILILLLFRQRRLNRKVALAREEADQASQAKSSFLSTMSHDLRTPLNGIVGFTDLALKEKDPEKRQKYLESIKLSSDLLTGLVNDTLELSRIESGKMKIEESVISCQRLSAKVLASVAPLAEAKHIHFSFSTTSPENEMVWIDSLKVEKIMLNLVSNAIKYTPEGGTVSFGIEELKPPFEGMTRRITVKDNGIGMSEEFQKHLYEPFAQERRKESVGVGGTGLGLSIVQKMVTLLGGRIRFESRIGVGTTFIVELPVKTADPALIENEKPKPIPFEVLPGKRVLLVEDNAINRQIANIMLHEKGVEVVEAVNGKEGVDLFLASPEESFAAILMDLRMPIMDGYEACREIRRFERKDASRIPIIAMTADAFEEQLQSAKEAGMDGAVTKPIDPQRLFEELTRLIERNAKE